MDSLFPCVSHCVVALVQVPRDPRRPRVRAFGDAGASAARHRVPAPPGGVRCRRPRKHQREGALRIARCRHATSVPHTPYSLYSTLLYHTFVL